MSDTPKQNINENEEKFLMFYMEQTWEEMRHLENLRERVSALILTIASLLAGFVVQQQFGDSTRIIIWVILGLGVIGVLFTLKIFQIHQMGQKRLTKWYEYLEKYCGTDPQILKLRKTADQENKADFCLISLIPHNYFWTIINASIIVLSVIMLNQIKDVLQKNDGEKVGSKIEVQKEVNESEKDSTIKLERKADNK